MVSIGPCCEPFANLIPFFSVASQKAESISDLSTTICKCDDCLLGITDALADLVLWNSSNSIQYASIDENTELQHKNSASSSTNDSQGQFKPTEKLLKRKDIQIIVRKKFAFIVENVLNQPNPKLNLIMYV
jgi:hypothetical protein